MTSYEGEYQMLRTWKPVTAGIVNIICGALLLIGGVGVLAEIDSPAATSWARYVTYSFGLSGTTDTSFTHFVVAVIGAALIIPGIISILGGFYAVRRRLWVMALVGSIPAIIYLAPTGILSITLTAFSRKEFHTGGKP